MNGRGHSVKLIAAAEERHFPLAATKERTDEMKTETVLCMILALAMVFMIAACGNSSDDKKEAAAPAAEDLVLKNEDLQLTVPAEYADLVVTGDLHENVLFSVSEKASVEAAKALGESGEGAGWLFDIARISEDDLHEMLCYDMSGREVIASDASGNYYLFCHPTDVRMVRENNEEMYSDRDQWSALNEWAWSLCESFIDENPSLRAEKYGNTELEMYLNRILYQPGMKYTVSTLEYGPLDPKDTDATEYVRALTEGVTYDYIADAEAPDGEYAVITFPEFGDRFDFFFTEGGENFVRHVWGDGYEELYKADFADPAVKASEVVYHWYRAIAEHTGGTMSYTPDDMLGRWAEKIAGRGVITISSGENEGEYSVSIHWGSSAFESANWEMTANATGNGAELRYENAKCYIRTYTSETEFTDAVEYENGTGSFTLNSANEIMWDDETAHAGDNCVFVNVD